jgi:manganese/zinc/iron transport system ATP- binding protein
VTAHDAFAYFGARYGLELESIQGLSTEAEANLAAIEALVRKLVDRRVPAVFAETSVPDRAVRALIEGAGARGQRVALGGNLFSDAMGKAGTYEGTYEGMIDHNVTIIARALGGQAPARGAERAVGGMSIAPPLSVSHLTVAYGERPAVWDVTWNAPTGLTAIVGPNGAGKSTLLKATLGLVPALSWGGPLLRPAAGGGARPDRLPAAARQRGLGLPGHRARCRVHGALPADALVGPGAAQAPGGRARRPSPRWGWKGFAERQIGKLSGGQQQRVFLARALAQDADLVLMDEPFAAVDAATEQAIVTVLRDLVAKGRHVVAVHHDLGTVPRLFLECPAHQCPGLRGRAGGGGLHQRQYRRDLWRAPGAAGPGERPGGGGKGPVRHTG